VRQALFSVDEEALLADVNLRSEPFEWILPRAVLTSVGVDISDVTRSGTFFFHLTRSMNLRREPSDPRRHLTGRCKRFLAPGDPWFTPQVAWAP
jgi:hypothetical protein